MKGTIDLLAAAANKNDKPEKKVAFKNNAPFRLCISKIKSTLRGKSLAVIASKINLLCKY